MNFDRLRYLAAVARTGSIRAAAKSLHVTPGAVSKGLSRLETETALALLVPAGRGIVLTDDGAWLAERAQRLSDEFTALRSELTDRTERVPELCIAAHDVFATWFPARLGRQFLPGVPLSVRERWPGEIEQAVAHGISDVGITYQPVATEGVEHVLAARVAIAVYVRSDAFGAVGLDDLPFVVPSHPVSGTSSPYGPLDGWPADAAPRTVRYRTSSLEAQLEFVRSGLAAVMLPRFVADLHNRRARSAERLMTHPSGVALGPLAQRVHVVRRIGAAPALRARTDVVLAAVSAMCDSP